MYSWVGTTNKLDDLFIYLLTCGLVLNQKYQQLRMSFIVKCSPNCVFSTCLFQAQGKLGKSWDMKNTVHLGNSKQLWECRDHKGLQKRRDQIIVLLSFMREAWHYTTGKGEMLKCFQWDMNMCFRKSIEAVRRMNQWANGRNTRLRQEVLQQLRGMNGVLQRFRKWN